MKPYRILVVEDDQLIAESLCDILECLEHQVVGTAASGEKALDLLKNTEADLILLDIQLNGGMDGVALAEIIKKDYDLPFIFTTAFADPQTIEKARDMGPFGYIVKPYGIKDIHASLEVAMGTYRSMQELKQSQLQESYVRNNHLYVKMDSRLVKIKDDDILYIEAQGDYAVFKTEKKSYVVHTTMKNIEQKLDPEKFLKVHRSFIVNLDHIVDIEDTNLLIKEKVIPVSRGNRESLMNRIHTI
ncbi:MAG TPA: DNA-binding response regulator [Cryomorphaceae bacterium]|nr:DNA-binding response regulator [Owenweeksia sp.]MBF98211.1 DNA-binding response regulator [Owenweeksia sp.]HAD97329.1 DNA-binding response regulator [Cryomorphaceae bacterium]HBF19011.1 DNA-binding response regulator [Cryomorphaceae bacterium]HCQ16462.1 DNA-binding response regulator [Cryomorphaceae bacterium]|tara:strand:- start:2035 stop:2766 length:732 start_codon:yes stop_codon:yes gene_type:complete